MIEMNERRQDFELLQRFTRDGEQSAFADVVRRHIDLVFGTALRKVEESGAAQEVAQNVFTALARKAWTFAPDDSLPAWLHKTALFESKSWLRGELSRRRREQTAAELGTTMKTPEDQIAYNALVPLLDDALLSLREKDRTALLLRFYEHQSLREVGAAFGVSEDTAQKRVQSALEKVADFFKRRGFKTASVAGAVAALQHAAASASTAMVNSVVGAALQAAPPALVGLGAWLARLASLSRGQTVAVCAVLAAVPVGWQLNEKHAAGEEAKRIRIELTARQNEGAALQREIDRLRLESGRLEQSVAQADEAAARAAESARAFDAWKQSVRGQLMAADYRWDDNSLFVRIPKSALPVLSTGLPSRAPFQAGIVADTLRELLGLSPQERQAMEETMQRVAELQRGKPADVYERDVPTRNREVAAREFTVQPTSDTAEVGAEAEQRIDQMLATFRSMLGEQRWQIIPDKYKEVNCQVWNRALITESPPQWVHASVDLDASGALKAVWTLMGSVPSPTSEGAGNDGSGRAYSQPVGYSQGSANVSTLADNSPDATRDGAGNRGSGRVYSHDILGYVQPANPDLSTFLPDAAADAIKPADSPILFPEAIRRRMAEWFHEQAVLRLGGKEQP